MKSCNHDSDKNVIALILIVFDIFILIAAAAALKSEYYHIVLFCIISFLTEIYAIKEIGKYV